MVRTWTGAFLVHALLMGPSATGSPPPGHVGSPPDRADRLDLPDYDIRLASAEHPAQQTAPPAESYLGGPAQFLTGPASVSQPETDGWDVGDLQRRLAPFGLNLAALSSARCIRRFVTEHDGVTHLTFQQRRGGLDVLGCRLRASMMPDGRIVGVSHTMWPARATTPEASEFVVRPQRAVELGLAAAGIPSIGELKPAHRPLGPDHKQTYLRIDSDGANVQIRQVYFPMPSGALRPAWEVVVPDGGNASELVVDAGDGTLLKRQRRRQDLVTEPITLRIFEGDSPAPGSPGPATPTGQQAAFIDSDLLNLLPQDIPTQSPAGWMPDGTNQLAGNNVDAHLDQDGNDVPDLPPLEGSPYRVFDFPSTHPDELPGDYSDASVVQLFHICNVFHDRLYALGFNEAAHNFQFDNLGKPGQDGDGIQADAQDGAAANLASFSTGPQDGSAARLQSHLFVGPIIPRDGAFERDLIYHELAHGLSVRLLESLPAGPQPQALAEGWSDFLAIALNAQQGDDPHAPYPFAPYIAYRLWVGYQDNYYFGLRRYPYSTDLNLSPLTYADIDPARLVYPPSIPRNQNITTPADQRHNAGEIWANALLECRAVLMDRHGFSGNEMMMQRVVDAMMLGPANPNFIQARDAILNADLINDSGANLDILWPAFAKRGLGATAQSPGIDVANLVQAFDVPNLLILAYPDGLPSTALPNLPLSFSVVVHSVGNAVPIVGTAMLHYALNADPFASTPLTPTGLDQYQATLPPAPCLSTYRYYFTVDDPVLGTFIDPPLAPDETFETRILQDLAVTLQDDMELDTGWTVNANGDDDATAGQWTRMDPQGTSQAGAAVQPEDDHSSDPGTVCWVTDGRAGALPNSFDVDGGKTTLTSPVINTTGDDALISYWRWFSNDAGPNPNEDTLIVELTADGGAQWTHVETVGPAGPHTSGGWFFHEILVSTIVAPLDAVQLRFIVADNFNGSIVEAAVDDLTVTDVHCEPPLQGDANGDGIINLTDYSILHSCLSGPDIVPSSDPQGCLMAFDFNDDTDVDAQDFYRFQTIFESP